MTPSVTRRLLLGGTVSGLAVRPGLDLADDTTPAHPPSSVAPVPRQLPIVLQINGNPVPLSVDLRTSLLDALRERAGLTGTKNGCDRGACGAGTVHIEGRRVLSCLTLAARCQGESITTIEGLSENGELHPVQAAFLHRDGFQCGYCTPGQIMSAVALIKEGHAGSDSGIREWMSGNICRCGAYPKHRRGDPRSRRKRFEPCNHSICSSQHRSVRLLLPRAATTRNSSPAAPT